MRGLRRVDYSAVGGSSSDSILDDRNAAALAIIDAFDAFNDREGETGFWSLQLMLKTLSTVALVDKSIGVDIIVHDNHPARAPQVVQIDRDGLLPQECVQRLYQMFAETASMAAVTGAQQCLHMCSTMMLQVLDFCKLAKSIVSICPQVIDAAVEALDQSMLKLR